jgi:NAD(P)-dependent dehydrogenase (short-subunit alcohol dehydrogenase family)
VPELTFHERVVIVTGAGRGLGRSYARLLASRGARLVVNNRSGDAAREVVAEIVRAGGSAVAAIADITLEGAAAYVLETGLRTFGRVDALVNNAGGNSTPGTFAEAQLTDLQNALDPFVFGPWRMTQAVWPHFVERGYGRLVFVSSLAVYGHPTHVAYATAKSALHGLSRCLSLEGAEHGILVNTVMPTALTRGTTARREAVWYDWARNHMTPEHVAPLVALLVHEDCPISGEVFSARAGQFHLLPYGLSEGITLDSADVSPETLLKRFDEVLDITGFAQVKSAADAVARMTMPPR